MAILVKMECLIVALYLTSFISLSNAKSSNEIGMAYGRLGKSLPLSDHVASVKIIKSLNASRVKLYDANPTILRLLSETSIEVSIMIPNQEISLISTSQDYADQWVQHNIVPYQKTMIRFLLVGNQNFTDQHKLVPAMEKVGQSLKKYHLLKIKIKYYTKSFSGLETVRPQHHIKQTMRRLHQNPIVQLDLACQWPVSSCNFEPVCPTMQLPMRFTIHGGWQKVNLPNPAAQNSPVTIADVLHVYGALLQNWPDCQGKVANGDMALWSGQWMKHGYNTGMLRQDYFTDTLRMFADQQVQLMFTSILNMYPPGPNQAINLGVLSAALVSQRYPTIAFQCNNHKNLKTPQLLEVKLRFQYNLNTRAFTWVNNPAVHPISQRCGPGTVLFSS